MKNGPFKENAPKTAYGSIIADGVFTIAAFFLCIYAVVLYLDGDSDNGWKALVVGLLCWIASCQLPEFYRNWIK